MDTIILFSPGFAIEIGRDTFLWLDSTLYPLLPYPLPGHDITGTSNILSPPRLACSGNSEGFQNRIKNGGACVYGYSLQQVKNNVFLCCLNCSRHCPCAD
ncbi:hypothetical protein I7I50_00300 [Histoplasma capsulatum G186AR]|uniref:Uncharacterized protein n=1 Tax=Ajellomyces capsulatus TaxID=5037 RepID=A0A8H7YJ76_AJECA|nr:hypothetical protein I7I52_07568 [Histoplasma capsulatum]QSS72447.1 hypothetical protein I7I50_00300 [Histoplasma capsulatum G186AR]